MAARPLPEITKENERRAWELRRQCWTEQRIAEHLGIDQSTVSRMLKRVEERLAKEFSGQAERIKAQQTAQLEQIADEAFQAWKRSQEGAESQTTVTESIAIEARDSEGKKCSVPGVKTTKRHTIEGQAGDPRFLGEARGALSDIRDIWGLDAPKKTDVTTDGQPLKVYAVVSPDDL